MTRGCARKGPAGRPRRRDKQVNKWITLQMDKNYERTMCFLYGGEASLSHHR
jgi:hypothetical protein